MEQLQIAAYGSQRRPQIVRDISNRVFKFFISLLKSVAFISKLRQLYIYLRCKACLLYTSIADGHYYSRCFKELKKYYCNPEILEKKPESIIRDPDIKKKNPKYISR